jgi:hypothetical protein
MAFLMALVAKANSETRRVIPQAGGRMTRANAALMLIARPSPRLLHRSPDVGSSPGKAGIAGEVLVFEGTSDPVLGHAIGKSGDTKRYVCGSGPVLVPSQRTEAFKR